MEQCEKCRFVAECCVRDKSKDKMECEQYEPAHKLEINEMTAQENKIYGGLYGAAIGDAVGVPLEFKSRKEIKHLNVTQMRGNGTHSMPIGTWSDDTSLTLCLIKAVCEDNWDLEDIANNFIRWFKKPWEFKTTERYFDIGGTTRFAIYNMIDSMPLHKCGINKKSANGNGSLMRILPLSYIKTEGTLFDNIKLVENISALTHAHLYSRFSCVFYVVYCNFLYNSESKDKIKLFREAKRFVIDNLKFYYEFIGEWDDIQNEFKDILDEDLSTCIVHKDDTFCDENEVIGDGYCVNTLKSALWSFFDTNNYKDCILKAVNLGDDTDTTACVAGGLAGTYYGFKGLPDRWVQLLERKEYLQKLYSRFVTKYYDSEGLFGEFLN